MQRWWLALGAAVVLAAGVFFLPSFVLSADDLAEGHVDLANTCLSCHELMAGTPSAKCKACHLIAKLDQRPEAKFSHELTDTAECTACHRLHLANPGDSSIHLFRHEQLREDALQDCVSCHRSPEDAYHQRSAVGTCDSCHTTVAWSDAAFDHADLEPTEMCTDCHDSPEDRIHRDLAQGCEDCHNTRDWSDANFDHGDLQGERCISCHDLPSDRIHESTMTECGDCHLVTAWRPSTYDHSEYFRFDRRHKARCSTCHANGEWEHYSCYGCHEHSERKIAREHREEGIRDFDDCVACHRSGSEREAKQRWRELRARGLGR